MLGLMIDIAIRHIRNVFEKTIITKYRRKFAAIPANVPLLHGYAV